LLGYGAKLASIRFTAKPLAGGGNRHAEDRTEALSIRSAHEGV